MLSSALKKVAVGLALIGAVGAAAASPIIYDLGLLSTTKGAANIQIEDSFNDVFKFTVGTLPNILVSVVGLDAVLDLSAQYRYGVGSSLPTSWSSWSAFVPMTDPSTGVFSYTETDNGLSLGQTYWIDIQGSATSAAYSVTLAPVPEPETYALLLTGLGLIGAIARRRKVNTAVQGA